LSSPVVACNSEAKIAELRSVFTTEEVKLSLEYAILAPALILALSILPLN